MPQPRATAHCRRCNRRFNSELALFHHQREDNHLQFECRRCDDTFSIKEQRIEHEADDHYLCVECDCQFPSRLGIRQHLKSSKHVDYGLTCPFCNSSFNTATPLTHHIENGSCRQARGMDRDGTFEFVSSRDPLGQITNRLIGGPASEPQKLATDWAWNGKGYECFYVCHKTFRSLEGLNQHLMSPVHRQSLYHCPKSSCGRQFSTLAGLVNHLESECCGAMRFSRVQSGVASMIAGGRLLT